MDKKSINAEQNEEYPQLKQARRADEAVKKLVDSLSEVRSAAETIRGCSSFAAIVSQQMQTINHLEQTLKEAQEKAGLQRTMMNRLEAQKEKLEQQLPIARQDAERHKTKAIGESKRCERLTTECDTLRKLNIDLQKQISSLQMKVGESFDRSNDLQQVLQKTLHSLERERSENARLTDSLLLSKKTIQTLRQEKSDVLKNFCSMSERLHEEAKGFAVMGSGEKTNSVTTFRKEVALGTSIHAAVDMDSSLSIRRDDTPEIVTNDLNIKMKKKNGNKKWTVKKVMDWFDTLELPQYRDRCKSLKIDGSKLQLLTDMNFLRDKMRVDAELHRRKIRKNAKRILSEMNG